jgi:DnaK suppressor protein
MTKSILRPVLTHDQHAMFAKQLDEQLRFRTEQVEYLSAPTALTDHASTAAVREVRDAVLLGARHALADIESARGRLADGRYGSCQRCSEPLAVERLEVLPHAALCTSCQRESTL